MPGPGGYWLCPLWSASAAASSIDRGPSVSGKPCPRLTEPVRTASADISAKIVVPNGRIRATSGSIRLTLWRTNRGRRTSGWTSVPLAFHTVDAHRGGYPDEQEGRWFPGDRAYGERYEEERYRVPEPRGGGLGPRSGVELPPLPY